MNWVKSKFPKTYEAQWSLHGAILLNLIVQSAVFLFSRYVKDNLGLRMSMEHGYDKFYICCSVNLAVWYILVSQRDRLNLPMLAGFVNLHALSLVYITGQVGEMQDSDRAFTLHLQLFLIMDLVSTYL